MGNINKESIVVSSNKNILDLTLIHNFLSHSYWAKERTIEQIEESIKNSTCFGIYVNEEQVGFARVLTDRVVFAYLMDVFILDKHRKKGYSKILLSEILNYPEFSGIGKWFLATRDAHDLYKQFKFVEIPEPEIYMERVNLKTK
ncbi:MAG: N-acetyltransferase [Sphingobacteriia bacterium]|nr:MAG: N-acetyltransferase [Sphingobacteriia bacterium]TAG30224.1 MAG: N-acetyltransferase [Sphingobacteriia bacterium]TAH08643.1 MAG: N-acetyltransferase [Sphingobacteriia bacterium]